VVVNVNKNFGVGVKKKKKNFATAEQQQFSRHKLVRGSEGT
jgi:hypothetical protein